MVTVSKEVAEFQQLQIKALQQAITDLKDKLEELHKYGEQLIYDADGDSMYNTGVGIINIIDKTKEINK